jgi:hypothetical protein
MSSTLTIVILAVAALAGWASYVTAYWQVSHAYAPAGSPAPSPRRRPRAPGVLCRARRDPEPGRTADIPALRAQSSYSMTRMGAPEMNAAMSSTASS